MNHHSLRLPNQTSGIMQFLGPPWDAKNVSLGMLGEFGGLTTVLMYTHMCIPLQRAVVLASLILGLIDAG